jgi:hypothetical protein
LSAGFVITQGGQILLLAEKIKHLMTWQNLITFISLTAAIVGLWPVFMKDKAHITYSIISDINVLDIKQPVSDLSIIFKGEDIQKKSLELKILTVKITNDGDLDISQSMFDQDVPWGLSISSGKIIEHRLSSANNYISTRLSPQQSNLNSIEFKKVIFETGQSFTLEMLILHPKDIPPEIHPVGKIIGIGAFQLSTTPSDQSIPAQIDRLIQHPIIKSVLMALATFIFLLSMFFLLALYALVKTSYASYKRKKKISRVIAYQNHISNSTLIAKLIDFYSKYSGDEEFKHFCSILHSKEKLSFVLSREELVLEMTPETIGKKTLSHEFEALVGISFSEYELIMLCKKEKLITEADGQVEVSEKLLNLLDQLLIELY